ncbi:hypothetical protein M501DRAFT_1016136 [Patellaria atrata CBS 101060]|uniref:Uncharacterized protein n=1 Tax=Patellaria atrata CBS 101060 TaxID=1346257 RepID=A0A9P4VR55_9PEZI|nr:hypothetical protein M501DRAFT_1016136 [Patellaria atrata CBS 101060]
MSTSSSGDASGDGRSNDMVEYTSGRWIYNGALRLRERALKSDGLELRKEITTSVHSADVISLQKIAEGGFNRVFQATCNDGKIVLARLPYLCTEPESNSRLQARSPRSSI